MENKEGKFKMGILKSMIVKRVSDHFIFIKHVPNHKLENICEDISRLDMESLINI